ncbi:putative uncharacterized protein [Rhodococcus sp. AW25M09]|uniref:hypothetical protein n=1 Tax=Rhodococcus sp. AW25M09 TaxID=1268303 RepID=UPI0002AC289B|nr:hypothetical protein [Rhodococcus sp. AW25M09]CCQ16149.1 putative uncharacterized protein [Rhodococcus sp. AW25M09]
MTSDHSELGADLLALAETVLTRLEPILRGVSETQQDRDQQGCSWCPVCALAALVRGERHDLVELVATEGAVVIALLRQFLADHTSTGTSHSDTSHSGTSHAATSHSGTSHAGSSAPPSGSTDSTHSTGTGREPADASMDTKLSGDRQSVFVPITVRVNDSRTDEQNRP